MNPPLKKFQALLARKTVSQLLSSGEIINVQTFAQRIGYGRQQVYRLIRAGKLAPVQRGYGWGSFFFLPEQVKDIFHRAER